MCKVDFTFVREFSIAAKFVIFILIIFVYVNCIICAVYRLTTEHGRERQRNGQTKRVGAWG